MALARGKAFGPEASSIFTSKLKKVEQNMTLIFFSPLAGIKLKMYFKKYLNSLLTLEFLSSSDFLIKDLSQRQHILGPFQFFFGIFIDIQ